MNGKSIKDQLNSKSQFLEKFAGKLNVVTKHGEIKDENTFKLPLIKTTQSNRSNTYNFGSSKRTLNRCSSDYDRNFLSKSAASNVRAHKYLAQRPKLRQISNCFLKDSIKKGVRLSKLKLSRIQPFSAAPLIKKTVSVSDQFGDQFGDNFAPKQIKNTRKINDYADFLSQLDQVSTAMKNRKIR